MNIVVAEYQGEIFGRKSKLTTEHHAPEKLKVFVPQVGSFGSPKHAHEVGSVVSISFW